MAAPDLTTILAMPGIQMAGGELMAYEGATHISLGFVGANGVVLNDVGSDYFAQLDAVTQGAKQAAVAAVIAEAQVVSDSTVPQAIEVTVADQAALAEALS